MTCPVKFRSHIEKVWRVKPDENTRLGKLRLDKNERIAPFPDGLWKRIISELSPDLVMAYPEVWPLYKKLSDFHHMPVDYFLLTAGADAAIKHCFEAFVAPGSKVIYPKPTFAMVPVYSELYEAQKAEAGYDRALTLDTDYILESMDERTTLVILANPNSPTGTYVPNDMVAKILEKALLFQVPVLVDEAYYGFCLHSAVDMLATHPNLLVARTFSKIGGIAGLRIGYIMGRPEVIELLSKFRPMYEVNSLAVHFANAMINNWDEAMEYGRKTVEGRNRFAGFLKDAGFRVVNTEANFLHVDFERAKKDILNALEAEKILVRGMLNVPGFENYTRFSVGPWESMKPAVDIITTFASSPASHPAGIN